MKTEGGTPKESYLVPFIAAALAMILLSLGSLVHIYLPGFTAVEYPFEGPVLVVGDRIMETGSAMVVEGGQILVSLDFFLREVDSHASWDEEEGTLTVTTEEKLVRMNTQQLTAYINANPVDLYFPLQDIEGSLYLPVEFLLPYYSIQMTWIPETDVIIMDREELLPLPARALRDIKLRQEPSFGSPYYSLEKEGAVLKIFSEGEGWYRVRTEQGLMGYIPKKGAELEGALTTAPSKDRYPRRTPWRPMGERINLTWEFAYRKRDTRAIPPMPGLNVVSPTWFHLRDEEGNLQNLADPLYVSWAHDRGYQVWALVTNNFDRDLTHQVLKSPARRQKVIDQLLAFSALYNLDGINIDFENMHFEDRDLLTQFMRELTPLAHEQGLTVSIDVTMISSSLNWSRIYDRPALAEIVDYVALMAYDEHWASSPVAGPVASLPWVERGLKAVLEEVPAEKLLLGIPFYARLWEEKQQEGAEVKVSSRAYSMGRVQEILKENKATVVWDEKAGQRYGEYRVGDTRYRVWIEDEDSIRQRVELVKKYNLAGIASWRRGLEDPQIWNVINHALK